MNAVCTLLRDLEAIRVREQAEALRLWAVCDKQAAKRDYDRDFIQSLTRGSYARRGYRI